MRMRLSLRLPSAATRWMAALAVVALPALAGAQDTVTTAVGDSLATGRGRLYEISAITGYQWFDNSSALKGAGTLGLRAVNPHILARVPGLSFGVTAAFSRPTTKGSYFPWNRHTFVSDINRRNDTTLVYEVSQRVTMAHYAIEAGYRIGGAPRRTEGRTTMERLLDWRAASAEASLGLGGYAFWEDPEQNHRNEVHAHPAISLGAGLGIPLPRNTTLRLRADDLILTRYDREWFSLYDPLFSEELFPNPMTPPPAAKSTIHNMRLSIQFSFVPGAER